MTREPLSDDRVRELFAVRKRRQWRVFWIGLPAILGWMALAFVAFWLITSAHPTWESPILMGALMAPGFIGFLLVAARFTGRNLRCPACDGQIDLYGTGYYARHFDCLHCGRALSR